jgi:outer membrane protein OmpU
MNNSTRNLKMKKLLIATTALVATAGMASADITISGHAAAGIYSGLDSKAAHGVVAAPLGAVLATAKLAASATNVTLGTTLSALKAAQAAVVNTPTNANTVAAATAQAAYDKAYAADTAADLVVSGSNVAMTPSADGVYSNAGVDFTMTGATDNGISFSATVNIDAGNEIDAGDFELDGPDGGTAGLGAVTMSGAFGTLTFDESGIDNLYSVHLDHRPVVQEERPLAPRRLHQARRLHRGHGVSALCNAVRSAAGPARACAVKGV